MCHNDRRAMSDKTSIEWTDATWNPIRGTKGTWSCVKVSEGCTHCYAERLNERRGGPPYAVGKDTLRLDEEILTQPLRWKRPRKIFVCSMTDLFEERVPSEWIARVFAVMALAPQHIFQVLTKRAERMATLLSKPTFLDLLVDQEAALSRRDAPTLLAYRRARAGPLPWPLPNVHLGVSVENQARADERIPWLLKTPAAVRFLSVEPLLGPVDISAHLWRRVPIAAISGRALNDAPSAEHGERLLDWVIVGGESGGPPERALVERPYISHREKNLWKPKPDALEWVRSLRDQCVSAGVPYFFKQFGGPTSKSGGRLLDGEEWSQFPANS